MSPEERQLLTSLFDRVRTASATARDPDAESLIAQASREQPYASYYLAQAVIIQEKGLEAAANRIKELESRVHQLEAAESEHHQAEQGGGFLSSIFGSASAPPPAQSSGPWGNAPRQAIQQERGFDGNPRAMPQQQAGPWNPQPSAPSAGGSFLQGALGTAAGVAGGMLLANSLSGIFGSHMSSLGLGSPLAGSNPLGSSPVEETVINNYFGDDKDKTQTVADDKDVNADNDDDNAGLQQADYQDDDDDQSDFGNDDTFDV
ncbi:ABC transporter substrate-binding protein [Rhizobium sp. AC44/96]|uniref:DUF2076 domain-containing protein n=1 Tax=Rhizobium sp. AC44/96 TaxID=1841654 RepID=UPI00081016D1|nr:DUF2076 domain-containing protein [Rhizobium sp. AC44/96]OCJ16266.1 ABC transporter substrate-binding protein [Rhizobium sp. AC44/96]